MKTTYFEMPEGWRPLVEGEPLKTGDTYGVGFEFKVGGPFTDLREGDKCPGFIMTFHPRRKICADS
ncbi:MAG TPA: hypothetical protein VN829_03250 [Dongiaceae bacterium]|nr:hypothetical protein [Dongiaceae bacterium]